MQHEVSVFFMLPKIDNPERLTKLFEHPAFENGDNTKNKNKTKNNVDYNISREISEI